MFEAAEITTELARIKHLDPGEYKILQNLENILSVSKYKSYIQKIDDHSIKEILEKYILRYLQAIYKQ